MRSDGLILLAVTGRIHRTVHIKRYYLYVPGVPGLAAPSVFFPVSEENQGDID